MQTYTNTATTSAPMCLEQMYEMIEKIKALMPAFNEIVVAPFMFRRIMRAASGEAVTASSAFPYNGMLLSQDYRLMPWEWEKRINGALVEKCEFAGVKADFENFCDHMGFNPPPAI